MTIDDCSAYPTPAAVSACIMNRPVGDETSIVLTYAAPQNAYPGCAQ
jgi:hypothetical protein